MGKLKITALVERVAFDVLMGARMPDVARLHSVTQNQCREYTHRYCKHQDRDHYEWLAIEAANDGLCSPTILQLVNSYDRFIPGNSFNPGRPLSAVETDFNAAKKQFDEDSFELSATRNKLAKLRTEMNRIKRSVFL